MANFEPYFPIHKIKTGLYTPGNEFVLFDGSSSDYIGLYHILPNSQVWTESVPGDNTKRLTAKRFDATQDVIAYNKAKERETSQYVNPIAYAPILTFENYNDGFVYRNFVQKRNAPVSTIIEIDDDQKNSLNNRNRPGLSSLIWNSITIKWYLTGQFAGEFNQNAIMEAEKKFKGISKYLRNSLEFTK
jgi:hypothetical protein